MTRSRTILLLGFAILSIGLAKPIGAQGPSPYPLTRGEDWSRQLGKKVLLIGTAQNQKLGASILVDDQSVFVKDLSSWPAELLNQLVRVSGVLRQIELPVATQKDGAWSAGVAAPGKAFSLEKAKYELDPSCLIKKKP